MKADIGLGSYPVKLTGVLISLISLSGIVLCKYVTVSDPVIFANLHLIKLFTFLFASGLLLFLYSKEKSNPEKSIQTSNLLSRIFLMALYACLIVFSMIQSINDDYSIDIMVPVLFFLIVQLLFTVIMHFHTLSNRRFYLISTTIFIIGAVVILIV